MPAKKTTRKKSTKKSTRTTKAKKKASTTSGSSRAKAKSSPAGDKEVTIDRRRQDSKPDEAATSAPEPAEERRQKVQRRRQIDPTTCERDYSADEVEFMNAMDEYKRTSGRMFPTCSEVLEVIRELGYVRLSPAELTLHNAKGLETLPVADHEVAADTDNAVVGNSGELVSSLDSNEIATNGWTI